MEIRRTVQGALCAVGAPIGWLLIVWWSDGASPQVAIAREPGLYLYMTLSTMFAFVTFGWFAERYERGLERANDELENIAVTDALTGLRNRRFFDARLHEEHARADRTQRPLSLAMLDIDHFKRVNDEHGHPVGDEVLVEVSRRIASVVRAEDTAARVGGEEFALLLPETDLAAASAIAERIRANTDATPVETSIGPIEITISAGVAQLQQRGQTDHAFYAAADQALYHAKQSGRNRVMAQQKPTEPSAHAFSLVAMSRS